MLTVIEAYRINKGLTQAELSEKVGMNQMKISRMESKKYIPSPVEIEAIRCYLNIPEGIDILSEFLKDT